MSIWQKDSKQSIMLTCCGSETKVCPPSVLILFCMARVVVAYGAGSEEPFGL